MVVRPRRRDLELLSRWMEEGKLVSVVETSYPLDRIAEAEAHVATKHTRGKVVIAVA